MDDSAAQEGNATKRAWWGVKLVLSTFFLKKHDVFFKRSILNFIYTDCSASFIISKFSIGVSNVTSICRTSQIVKRARKGAINRHLFPDVGWSKGTRERRCCKLVGQVNLNMKIDISINANLCICPRAVPQESPKLKPYI